MKIELALLLVMLCLNLFSILSQLTRYSFYQGSKILYLRRCLLLGIVCIVQSCIAFVCLLLPQGRMLTFLALSGEVLVILRNCMMVQIVMGVTGFIRNQSEHWLHLLYALPLFGAILAATNGLHHGYAVEVVKAFDGIGYFIRNHLVGDAIELLSLATLLITFCLVLWAEWKSNSVNLKANLLLLLTMLLLPLLTYAELALEPAAKTNFHISYFFNFIPIYMICHVYLDYLRMARNRALELCADAYLLFDKWGFLVDANPQGEAFFREYNAGQRPTQRDIDQLFGMAEGDTEGQFQSENGEEKPCYHTHPFPVSGILGRHCGIGYIIRQLPALPEERNPQESEQTDDRLAGLKNRRDFAETAIQVVNRSRQAGIPVTLLMIDLDHFKQLNDTHGRSVGDEVLEQVCQVCLKKLRKRDALFRYGGEEFAILGEDMSRCEGEQIAKRIVEAVAQQSYQTSAGEIRATISVGGCTLVPELGMESDLWVDLAERQLYLAKAGGRNCICYQAWENVERYPIDE